MRGSLQCCSAAIPVDLEQSLLVERQHAEWFLAERVAPGAEAHNDRDVIWVVHAGHAWRNAGIMVRFSRASAGRRLDSLLARYQQHGRGMALWISPSATPENITDLLEVRRLRCRKHFPAMVRSLKEPTPYHDLPKGLVVRRVVDVSEFERTPHPAIGPLTTPLRRAAFERLGALVSEPSGQTREFVAWLNDKPVGAIEVFIGAHGAGIHSLTVLERYQQRGIGSALIEHGCKDARDRGALTIGLLATTEGQRVYMRRGFKEVARFGYWYRSFQNAR
jgi:ribosomal protein S18 acetylase RimI-like enzyme